MITNINSEDRLVQATFGDYLRDHLGWESVYAFNTETFGPSGSLGRFDECDVILGPDLRAAIARLNPDLPEIARQQALDKLTHVDFSRTMAQHNQTFYGYIRDGVPVSWMDAKSEEQHVHPPFTEEETNILADRIYEHVWQQSEAGNLSAE